MPVPPVSAAAASLALRHGQPTSGHQCRLAAVRAGPNRSLKRTLACSVVVHRSPCGQGRLALCWASGTPTTQTHGFAAMSPRRSGRTTDPRTTRAGRRAHVRERQPSAIASPRLMSAVAHAGHHQRDAAGGCEHLAGFQPAPGWCVASASYYHIRSGVRVVNAAACNRPRRKV